MINVSAEKLTKLYSKTTFSC